MSDVTHPDRRDFLRLTLAATGAGLGASAPGVPRAEDDAQAFLKAYNDGWLPLETAANEAAWIAGTDVSEAHTAAQIAKGQAAERVRRLAGSSSRLQRFPPLGRQAG